MERLVVDSAFQRSWYHALALEGFKLLYDVSLERCMLLDKSRLSSLSKK